MSEISFKLLALLNELLDKNKIESGKIILNKNFHEYIPFVQEIIEYNSLYANNKNIKIITDFPNESVLKYFDKMHMERVLNNLLSNAIKYSKSGSAVTVKVTVNKGNYLLTEVIDEGVGIPDTEFKKILSYLSKASTQLTSGETNHGLGLAIVKNVIEAHGGSITVKSIPDKGSNFYFSLPF